jgi:ABC-2 type transport system ATP-binding protein
LKRQVGGERIEVVVVASRAIETAGAVLKEVCGEAPVIDVDALALTAPAPNGAKTLIEVVRRLDAAEVEMADIGIHRATLDDVFLALTGQAATPEDVRKS